MRTPRLLASGTGYYHVILKTSGARFLFESDADKRALLGILERVSRFSGVQPLSYALLDNHVHLLLKVPERRSVPEAEFRRRVEALYGAARSGKLFAKWDKWRDEGRDGDIAFERDGLQKRMFDLGQFVKTAKEFFHVYYREAHDWEGTVWRGRYKSILVAESFTAFKALSLYIAMNPVRAGIAKRGTDSPWTSFGQAKLGKSFGWCCHRALLGELARLKGSEPGTDLEADAGADLEGNAEFVAKEFEEWMAEAEGVSRQKVKEALARGEGLSLVEMLVCRVHAFGNGRAIGTERAMRSVPRSGDAVAVPQCRAGLFTATRLSGCLYRVA